MAEIFEAKMRKKSSKLLNYTPSRYSRKMVFFTSFLPLVSCHQSFFFLSFLGKKVGKKPAIILLTCMF